MLFNGHSTDQSTDYLYKSDTVRITQLAMNAKITQQMVLKKIKDIYDQCSYHVQSFHLDSEKNTNWWRRQWKTHISYMPFNGMHWLDLFKGSNMLTCEVGHFLKNVPPHMWACLSPWTGATVARHPSWHHQWHIQVYSGNHTWIAQV